MRCGTFQPSTRTPASRRANARQVGSENAVRGSFFHYVYPFKNAVTVVQLMDFTEFAAMQQFDRVLASVECMTPASLADRARADGRRVVLTARSSRTEAAGGARAGVRMVQSREIRVPRCLAGWCVTVCASRADVRTQSRWTECCADIAAIQDRVRPEVPETPGGFVLLRL